MIFCSYEFLFLFLPIVLLGYYGLFRTRGRTVFLTLSSYAFYGWWDYRFCGLLLVSTLIDYTCGKQIVKSPDKPQAKKWVTLSIISNLSMLGFFKYYDLGASTVNQLAGLFSASDPIVPLLNLVLPVGISFYTFQTMSYCIDLYRKEAPPAKSFFHFACYVSLFPQLIAGPIVRYREVAEQLHSRSHTIPRFAKGIVLFTLGLGKKVLIADAVAPLTNFAYGGHLPGLVDSWVGVLAYTMQIYFDFSGYSDMAIGLGLMLGFVFPINFNSPYKAETITDFWRRWHISLSNWLRDYLYIPLGGSRHNPTRTYINLCIVMLLGGLWHGANWTFVIWGGYHGVLLAIERFLKLRSQSKRNLFRNLLTFILVMIGWVVFRAETVREAVGIWTSMLGFHGWGSLTAYTPNQSFEFGLVALLLATVLSWITPNTWELTLPNQEHRMRLFGSNWATALLLSFAISAILLISICVILVNTSSPFLYFQF